VYRSADEIEVLIALRQHKASTLPPGKARQSIVDEIARLRAEADLKYRDNVITIESRRMASRRRVRAKRA
jgi:hypothetical protein